jgi:hypothetical protein
MSQPRRLRARKLACVQTRHRKPSSFGSNLQLAPRGICPARASIGSGSRRAIRVERTTSRFGGAASRAETLGQRLTPLIGVHEFAVGDSLELIAWRSINFLDEHAVDRRARMEIGVRIGRESNGHELIAWASVRECPLSESRLWPP